MIVVEGLDAELSPTAVLDEESSLGEFSSGVFNVAEPKGELGIVPGVVVPADGPIGVPTFAGPGSPVRGCPKKPKGGTLACPRWMMRQSSLPVMGSV